MVPEVLRDKLSQEVHSGGFSGNFAVKGLYGKLCRRYWWNRMYADVYKFCKVFVKYSTDSTLHNLREIQQSLIL